MNEQERSELAALKDRQAWLERELGQLSNQLRVFEERLASQAEENQSLAQRAESKSTSLAPSPAAPITPGLSQTTVPPTSPPPAMVPPVIRTPVYAESKAQSVRVES